MDISVRSAHVSTLGPQAVDVFYVQEAAAGCPVGGARGVARRTPYAQALVAPSRRT